MRRHRHLLPFLGASSGVSVAAIYYNQPLLHEIGQRFHAQASTTGLIAVATQLGYAAGIFFFVPMADVRERRGVVSWMFAANALSLALAAVSPTLWALIFASVLIGLTAAVTHVLVPMAPELAEADESGRAIGVVMTGLLLGVLLGRTASGALCAVLGWRMVFAVAAAANAAFTLLLYRKLPKLPPPAPQPYAKAMRSLWEIFRTQPELRNASLTGLLVFAAFISFWTNLAFLLGERFHLGPEVAGGFGLIGAAGAMVAAKAGRWSDTLGARRVLAYALAILITGYLIVYCGQSHVLWLVVGVIVLDIGQQMMQIANQTRIFSLLPGARGRVNTIYMTIFFFGAALGSYGSTWAWVRWRWLGVCLFAEALLALAALSHLWGSRRPAQA